MKKKNVFSRIFRKCYRLVFPPLTKDELRAKKQKEDYEFLISHGVDTEPGYVELLGTPQIWVAPGAKIIMGKGVTLLSESAFNNAGVNHPVILSAEVAGAEIIIHDGVGMSGTSIVAVDRIEIGERTLLGANTNIYGTDFHPIDVEKRKHSTSIKDAGHGDVTIGADCWIGANSTILKGVSIGSGSVVGAMSLVNKSVPENVMAAGVPAKVIKQVCHD